MRTEIVRAMQRMTLSESDEFLGKCLERYRELCVELGSEDSQAEAAWEISEEARKYCFALTENAEIENRVHTTLLDNNKGGIEDLFNANLSAKESVQTTGVTLKVNKCSGRELIIFRDGQRTRLRGLPLGAGQFIHIEEDGTQWSWEWIY